MEIQASRCARASAPSGEPILLLDQNRARWDHAAHPPRPGGAGARRGARAANAARTRCRPRSPRATRARARPAETDWARIAALYGELARVDAVAGRGAESRRRRLDGVRPGRGARARRRAARTSPRCTSYHLLPSVRGDLLAKLGRDERGARRVRARRGADAQRARARAPAGARGGVRREEPVRRATPPPPRARARLPPAPFPAPAPRRSSSSRRRAAPPSASPPARRDPAPRRARASSAAARPCLGRQSPVPCTATGITGQRALTARRNAPCLKGWSSPSIVRVPSGKMRTGKPCGSCRRHARTVRTIERLLSRTRGT